MPLNTSQKNHLKKSFLFQSASTLASMNSKNASERQSNTKYAAWAAKQLKEKYQVKELDVTAHFDSRTAVMPDLFLY